MCGHGSLESDWLVRREVDIAQAVDRRGKANGDASDQHARGGKDVSHRLGLHGIGGPVQRLTMRALTPTHCEGQDHGKQDKNH